MAASDIFRRSFMAGMALTPFAAMARDDKDLWGYRAMKRVRIVKQSGSLFDMQDYHGKLLLVSLWAWWCPNCISEFQSMRRMQMLLGGESKVAIILVSGDKDWVRDQAYATEHAVPFPLAHIPTPPAGPPTEDLTAMVLGTRQGNGMIVSSLPLTYIIAPNGKLYQGWIGAQDWMSADILSRVREAVANGA